MSNLRFNPVPPDAETPYDPNWGEYVISLTDVIGAIATKLCGKNKALHQDCVQQALMELLRLDPTRINKYNEYMSGEITDKEWESRVSRYARTAARNIIISYLRSYRTGNLYTRRYKYVKDPHTGKYSKYRESPRYIRLDVLQDEYGLQVDTDGDLTWESSPEWWGPEDTTDYLAE